MKLYTAAEACRPEKSKRERHQKSNSSPIYPTGVLCRLLEFGDGSSIPTFNPLNHFSIYLASHRCCEVGSFFVEGRIASVMRLAGYKLTIPRSLRSDQPSYMLHARHESLASGSDLSTRRSFTSASHLCHRLVSPTPPLALETP